ncbi:nucleoside triphosphate pyrophosphohydrolase [Bacillus alkalicellulosilyticus]|uniref:nucleoside triphosphate pyrophosphohydrolase n=1 Tax=Alkalihalobacterium alkalicellulosilyticum TaxID=1912214 RepID=UPI0009989F2F|nr:nucleoside triphosphate pyrophosphohydrolase [Bacillus alkalicellulosilyticus]
MNKVTVIGLGAGNLDQMPLGVYREIKQSAALFVRTKDHPVLEELVTEGVEFTSFDDLYEKNVQFETVYESIVEELVKQAKQRNITYAVPGHPFVAEQTVQLLVQAAKEQSFSLEFIGGQSFLDPMFTAVQIDPIEGCQVVDGTSLVKETLQVRQHIVICQVYDSFIASEVKLTLMELLPDDYEVVVATAVGLPEQHLQRVKLFELDRNVPLSNLTAVYVPPVKDNSLLYQDFSMLRDVIRTLRGPNGCPWDKEQTHASLKRYLIEEAYEVLEAIDEEDDDNLVEELGDVLLQVMLHAQIGEDEGWFSVDDIIRTLTEKMIRRHPHVFAEVDVSNSDEVVKNWDDIKKAEKQGKTNDESIINSIPKGMPSLLKAYELQKATAKVGFDWNEPAPIWMKLQEEIAEFFAEIKVGNTEKMGKEFGDLLFVVVNLGRHYGIHPEEALQATNVKFTKRFQLIENELQRRNLSFSDVTLEELDEIWEETKKKYK